jgi:hypothetical protein
MVGGAKNEVEDYVGIGAGRDLASPHSALDESPVPGAQGFEYSLAPRDGQLRVSLRLRDQAGQHPAGARTGDRPGPRTQRRQKVAPKRAGVGDRELAPELSHEGVQRQRAARRPAPVDGGLAYAGTSCHFLHGHAGQPALGKDGGGRLEDGDVGGGAPRATGAAMAGTNGARPA